MSRQPTDIDKLGITLDPDGTATLTGIAYDDLRSLLTAACLHRQDNGFKAVALDGSLDEVTHANNLEACLWHLNAKLIVDVLTAKLAGAISPSVGTDEAFSRIMHSYRLSNLEQTVREAEAAIAAEMTDRHPDPVAEACQTITNALRDVNAAVTRLRRLR